MTDPTVDDLLVRTTDDRLARPLPAALAVARRDVLAAVGDLRTIPDAALARLWTWKGGGEEEVRYGAYRIGEAFELAGIDAEAAVRSAGVERGRAGDLIAPATAARWDLHGVLIGLSDAAWDADPGGGEWTVRRTMGHVISGQRAYGVGTGWWLERADRADDPHLAAGAPDALWDALPSEETEADAEYSPDDVRARLDDVLDHATERLAGLPTDQLALGARWAGFPVDIGFRLGRWSSHLREHTIQVEKTMDMLDLRPTEVDRLVRLVLAAWGRAEAVVYGAAGADEAVAVLAAAATGARSTAAEIAGLARD